MILHHPLPLLVMARSSSSSRVSSANYTRRMTTLSVTRRKSVGTPIIALSSSSRSGFKDGARPTSPGPAESTPLQNSRQHLRRACVIPARFRDRAPINCAETPTGYTLEVPPVVLGREEDQSLNPGKSLPSHRSLSNSRYTDGAILFSDPFVDAAASVVSVQSETDTLRVIKRHGQ